jgi:SNF2 family DNA or RNA helicase
VKLYPFQKEAVDKLESVTSILIADDMGLGKTVEAIALDCRRRRSLQTLQSANKTLIVAPLSALGSWALHLKMIWPKARVIVINPKRRQDLIDALGDPYHYYVIHWEALRLIKELQDIKWWHIIADEVHKAKNRKAQQTIALWKQRTKYKTGLSGTPADNAPQDLWSVLHWLYPRTWSSYWRFANYYIKIQVHTLGGYCLAQGCGQNHKTGFRKIVGVANVDELMGELQPYYIRRIKEDVLEELPDKYYTQILVDLDPKQRRIYNQMRSDMLAWVGAHEHEPIAAPIVVAQLTRLKQFALSYAGLKVMEKNDASGTPRTYTRVCLEEPSSKLDAVMDIIQDTNRPIVVFSESKQIINLLAKRLNRAGISFVVLTGDTSQNDRDRNINLFQSGKIRVFAGTIKAGGIGITLTAASTVVFLDRTWNPSQNRQAEDRLHRIGQKDAVHVIDIVARDTVDGGRLQMLKQKWEWLKILLGDIPSQAYEGVSDETFIPQGRQNESGEDKVGRGTILSRR